MPKQKTVDPTTINRSQMSRDLNVDVGHISRILNGIHTPSFKLAVRMAAYLDISVDELNRLLQEARSKHQ